MDPLTLEQKACNHETWRHINRVQFYLKKVVKILLDRMTDHDQSKLSSPEVELFTECTAGLAGCTYGSEEYETFKKRLKPALDHHYANNRHHPEHWKNGVDDMTVIDLIEMLCDWKAASERHNDGNIRKSIEINSERFNLPPMLKRILENSVDDLLS
jgi:hypothetical protein